MFGVFIYDFIFFAVPAAAVLFFGISLYRFCSAKAKNKKIPEAFTADEIKNRLFLLNVSSVILGVLILVVIGLIILLYMAVAYM